MYELGLPESLHIAVPAESEPQELFMLTVGTLGDVAAAMNDAEDVETPLPASTLDELGFSASFFDAFLESRFAEALARDTALLASSAYYLAGRPGSSLVLARHLAMSSDAPAVDTLLHWTLLAKWGDLSFEKPPFVRDELGNVARLVARHFQDGSGVREVNTAVTALRGRAYEGASPRELLLVDIIVAVVRMRIAASAWTTLPGFTGIASERWASAIRRPSFPKELWPSQILLGRAGIFSGASGIVQMPTSAGKTRSVEIVLRSGFLSGRTRLSVVVAPFRALCHEIGLSLRQAFVDDDVKIDEFSDALQLDFLHQIPELVGSDYPTFNYILVLTPEKLLYVLRNAPTLVRNIGIVVYEEGHQFDSGTRGITYELLLTEIKALLPQGAQTVLVSAVIPNAQAIGEWLIGDEVRVVNGSSLLPTSRSVAFASWIERRGQLMFFESGGYRRPDYFVPRVIDQRLLARRGRERARRYFPERDRPSDVALYLGLRLVPQGAVAIFCGRKDTASGVATRVVEIFDRGIELGAPAASADPDELQRLRNLLSEHYGESSIASRAAAIGVFVHHGTTPHGIRLSIEHAMQKGRINFVVCTSTLAQGVNLPIRYLIVPGIYQAGERVTVRDFQNLIGRAGRSGMHTEGLVIFSDPDTYDERQREPWRFNASVELLTPGRSESVASSLLEVLGPFRSSDGSATLVVAVEELCAVILGDETQWLNWASDLLASLPRIFLEPAAVVTDLRRRRRLIVAVESYLMANRGSDSFDEFKVAAEQLGMATLAHHLASDDVKADIRTLFRSVAEYVDQQEPEAAKQANYGRTLLGVKSAQFVERWVAKERQALTEANTNEEWLKNVWALFSEQSADKFFHTVEPSSFSIELARRWLQGQQYQELFEYSRAHGGTKQWGPRLRRRITDDDIVDFCENTLGFECSLILAAVSQFLFGGSSATEEAAEPLLLFQKALKYGLPDWPTISCYELGFADRVIAQRIAGTVRAGGYSGKVSGPELESNRELVEALLTSYPTYFEAVFAG